MKLTALEYEALLLLLAQHNRIWEAICADLSVNAAHVAQELTQAHRQEVAR